MKSTIREIDIRRLCGKTGFGMTDCKRALMENENDYEKAAKWLNERNPNQFRLINPMRKLPNDTRKGLVGKFYIYQGEKIEVISAIHHDDDSVFACDCKTTENFFDVKVSELDEEVEHQYD